MVTIGKQIRGVGGASSFARVIELAEGEGFDLLGLSSDFSGDWLLRRE